MGQALSSPPGTDGPPRLAVLGIGNELYGDDAAGAEVARALRARLGDGSGCLVFEAGAAPESFCGPLRRFRPDLVLLVDAVDMGEPPGSVAWVDWDRVDGLSASTHTLPPSVLATYLQSEFGCRVALLGIQAASLELGRPLAAPVRDAVEEVTEAIASLV